MPAENFDMEKATINLHNKMHSILKPAEYKIYRLLFIDHLSESDCAKKMGFKKESDGRKTTRYKALELLKKSIMRKVKKVLYGDEIDW